MPTPVRAVTERPEKPIEMSELSKVISEAAIGQLQNQAFLSHLRFTKDGILSLGEVDNEAVNQRNISYILAENFEDLDKKPYSVNELENLLGSTDIYQRTFALQLFKAGIDSTALTNEQVFGLLLDSSKEASRLGDRL